MVAGLLGEEQGTTVDTERSRALTREANALRAEGRWEEALPLCYEALRADPNNAAAAHNLGVMLSKMGRLAEGEAAARHALKIAPNSPMAVHALAHNLLAQGRYREAWPLYEARVHMPELNTGFPTGFDYPRWRGEALAGKRLAIFPEQGLGDQIQFSRFVPRLIEQAAAVTLLTLPPLERLFRHNFPGAEILCASGNVEFPDPDYWTTLHDLPAALSIALEDVPTEPYLRPPGTWPPLGEGFKIGLKTKGNPKFVNDATRSLPAEMVEALRGDLPGRLISLEPEESGVRDMADTAAIIDQLHMVVSVDTSVAHLAGAMGKPCLLLVPGFSADWRWMIDRTDSPWYPNHALYRGEINGDWRPAVERLIADARGIERTLAARGNTNQAIALRDRGKVTEALAAAEQAFAANSGDGRAVHTYGVLLANAGRRSESEAVLRRFLTDDPDNAECRHALALNLLAEGRYREAWPYYEARTEREGFDPEFPRNFPFPRWRGEDLKGKRIAVFPEQGFGDQIQFVRFVPELLRRGAQVILLTRPSLVRLFAHSFPDVQIVPTIGAVDFPDPDYWATLVDLPAMLDVAVDDVPGQPYLRWCQVRETAGEGPKIGFKLSGNPQHRNDSWRSLPPDIAERLRTRLPGTIVSLEPADSGARDFADTAALIAGLDLVIAVDTSVAHLAGAMGKPCLLLISGFDPDWRWMIDRTDSPWYPRHRLYRGGADGNWEQTTDRLLADVEPVLRRLAAERLMADAQALRAAGEPLKALAATTEAVTIDPDNVNAAYMHGVFLTHCGRLAEAEAVLRRVVEAAPHLPNPRDALGTNLLAQGRYREGWPLYEARTQREGLNDGFPRNFPFPRWNGEDLKGKRIAIFPEQGYGDQIQFARFVPRLLRMGAQVTLLTSPPLVRLFENSFPKVQVLSASGSVDFPDPDYWATLADLPVRFDAIPEKFWLDPYLHAANEADTEGETFRVGLMAQGNSRYGNDRYRSLPPDLAARLEKELTGTVVDLSPEKTGAKDFADTAAIIATLDLVVSVDTAVAHLAGAMGKTCLLMLPGFATDWRWRRERRTSPWYPEHVLYRAGIEAGWEPVVERILLDVKRLSASGLRYMRDAARLRAQGRYSEALAMGRKALAAEPNHPGALHNLARLLTDLGRIREGEALQRRAVSIAPKDDVYRYGLGLNLLSQGKYHEAWPLYESRTRMEALRSGFPQGVTFPRWQGEDIHDKLIAVFPEQGFGDQLQFARFLPQLRARCAGIVLLAPPALVRLFQTAFPDLTVVSASGEASFPRCPFWTTLVELGRLLDVRIEALPNAQYLELESHRPSAGTLRIGYMGRGNPGYVHDAHRSLPPEAGERLRASLPGEIVDLDPSATGAKDFLDTARIMADLDLIVSVDTSVGHLAGVLGKPCCLLVGGFATDWRWQKDREDSPWYSRHRLFRGTAEGNWEDAIARLTANVQALAQKAAGLPSGS